jgi:hypothetical protein
MAHIRLLNKWYYNTLPKKRKRYSEFLLNSFVWDGWTEADDRRTTPPASRASGVVFLFHFIP